VPILRRRPGAALRVLLALVSVPLLLVSPLAAQRVIREAQQVLTVSKGASVLVVNPTAIARWSIGDQTVAEAVSVSPTELVINGKTLGTTSLFLWDNSGAVRLFSVEVTADAAGLQRYLKQTLPDESIDVTASGNTVTLSGQVRDASVAARALEIVKGSGATVIDNLTTASPTQVMLKVRFAEVNRSAIKTMQSSLTMLNPHKLNEKGDWTGASDPTGLLDVGLASANANIELLIQALTTKGYFKTLAEPNLLTLPGHEASFLAGGEFPYPTIQGGGAGNAVTIVFKDFGIKLKFTPVITRNGSIRLHVAPEVSSLDFGNAVSFQGFTIPSLLTRRAETEVELKDGQYLVIAGLADNSFITSVSKIPILGDLPILGQFFRSKDARQRRTELLVLVSPQLVQPSDAAPALPTGEPETWRWDGSLKQPLR
jgi:pilus assembly protein CpaC